VPCPSWRRTAIAGIKLVHSAIFLVNAASVLHVFWVGVLGRPTRWTGFALAAALGETTVFLANRGRCPLTGLVETLGAESGRVSDIFLPRWFADRIPLVFGPPLAVGLVALAWRRSAGARRADRRSGSRPPGAAPGRAGATSGHGQSGDTRRRT
jgi:hypothetical protein